MKSSLTFIYPERGKENITKTLKNRGGFGSWLCERKVLAPLASIVLDGNRLGGLGLSAQVRIKLLYRLANLYFVSKEIKRKSFYYLSLTVVGARSYVFPGAMGNSKLT
ncbi:hypothetical protein QL285_012518 [Trifolium repens]|nr:hypothetical protein QL285_012518 [Trifolium repens]